MKIQRLWAWGILGTVALMGTTGGYLSAQGFTCGSTEAYGSIEVTEGTVTLDLPSDGIFNATTIHVASGATLSFNRNALNTPVYLLASGDVTIEGTIAVKGNPGTSSPPLGGKGGPGGFDGGAPGFAELLPGAGQGPGGGGGGDFVCCSNDSAGAGSYGARPIGNVKLNDGQPYGSPVLFPIAGGSGGGGSIGAPGGAGGGGGGALLLCSNTWVGVTGRIEATGGSGRGAPGAADRIVLNGGSGGAVRIVAPRVTGTGTLDVQGGCDSFGRCEVNTRAGQGRARIDSVDRSQLSLAIVPRLARSVGSLMQVFLNPRPRIDLVEVAGRTIPVGSEEAVEIFLPAGSSPRQLIRIQATDFTGNVPIDVVLSPENGDPIIVPAQIEMNGAATAEVSLQVDFPVNVVTHVKAWTR